MPRDENEIGALWLKERDGKKWLSGKIDGKSVVVFRNERKNSEKQPDYRVLLAKKKEEQAQGEPF